MASGKTERSRKVGLCHRRNRPPETFERMSHRIQAHTKEQHDYRGAPPLQQDSKILCSSEYREALGNFGLM